MGDDTKIQWTDATWNPTRGCTRISDGCRNCYAEGVAARFSAPGLAYAGLARMSDYGPRWTGKLTIAADHLDDPIRWRRPRRIFVNSMSDLFHEKLTYSDIARVFRVMLAAPRHTFQVLTKRAARMRRWVEEFELERGEPLPDHIHLGVSTEDQRNADERIPELMRTRAAVRFVSAEPLLGPIDFFPWIGRIDHCGSCGTENVPQELDACPACGSSLISTWGDRQAERYRTKDRYLDGGPLAEDDGPQIHWVIVGGESGRNARPFDVDWARRIVADCRAAGVAAFVKQLGAKPYDSMGIWSPAGAYPLHGPDIAEWEPSFAVREFPTPRAA